MLTQKSRNIKRYCALFFALVGLFNIAAGFYTTLSTADFVLMGLLLVPVLSDKRSLLLTYGVLGIFVSGYLGIACLVFHSNLSTQTPDFTYLMGYLFAVALLFASAGLAYAGLNGNGRTFSFV